MKWVFTIILLSHGLIHLMGFTKAFELAEINPLTQSIPKHQGMLWAFTTFLFLLTAFLFFLKNKWWFVIAFIAVIISQFLIVLYWKDAKFGTLINTFILLVSFIAYGNYQFNNIVQKESMKIFQNIEPAKAAIITKENIAHLPEIVQKWMKNSGTVGKQNILSVRLKQKGQMKTKPNTKWMPFTAQQYFNVETPSFVWITKVENNSAIYMVGRDKLSNGNGSMLIKLLALIPVVNETKSDKLNSGTMQRFLSEMCWFPSATLNNYIKWESIDNTSAKAILTIDNKSVSGIFKFNDIGEIIAFETNRYFGGNEDSKLEKWVINMTDHKVFDGYKIPYKCEVNWLLKEGDFNWLNLEITNLKYNSLKPYENK